MVCQGSRQGEKKGWDTRGRGRRSLETPKVHPELIKRLGIEAEKASADYEFFAGKHPEYFRNANDARVYVEHVLGKPTHILSANNPTNRVVVSLVKIKGVREPKAVAIGIVKTGGV